MAKKLDSWQNGLQTTLEFAKELKVHMHQEDVSQK